MKAQAVLAEKKPTTWVLVADGKQAQVYERAIVEKRIPIGGSEGEAHYKETKPVGLLPVDGMSWQAESPEIYEVGRNATGMVFESGSSARSMGEPHIDARTEVKQHFAKAVANQINKAATQKMFDKLIIAAPAKTLGELRKCLSDEATKRVSAELTKDLTHYKDEDLLRHLEAV